MSAAKVVALTVAWLHEAIMNEQQILDHTSVSKERYLEVLNTIFSKDLAKSIKS